MGILENVLNVILKAFAFVTTANASQYAYDALTAFMNLITKIVGSIGA